ncbi:MAG TPA: hypothetical protein VHF69_07155, partial [Candidatus Synoicihabitans sp.]|nr:hypothetical protein [Candidatus Synoicihabitans sp.]
LLAVGSDASARITRRGLSALCRSVGVTVLFPASPPNHGHEIEVHPGKAQDPTCQVETGRQENQTFSLSSQKTTERPGAGQTSCG